MKSILLLCTVCVAFFCYSQSDSVYINFSYHITNTHYSFIPFYNGYYPKQVAEIPLKNQPKGFVLVQPTQLHDKQNVIIISSYTNEILNCPFYTIPNETLTAVHATTFDYILKYNNLTNEQIQGYIKKL